MTGAAPADGQVDAPRVLLSLAGIGKTFGRVAVLHDIAFDVLKNEFLSILGPSGSGKTTILRLIGGFEEPSAGAIFFDGSDIAHVPINRRPFNTVFQDYALFPHMTVRQNVGYGLRVRCAPRAEVAARVAAVLETVGLGALGDRLPSELSGGQRQRVALARAIVLQPRLVLLDEPLAALDVELRGQMRRFLKDLQRRVGITFLFITHDQEEAITLSDRIVVMRQGRVEQTGRPEDLYYLPETGFVASFFGENNLVPGTLARQEGGRAHVDSAVGPLACRSSHVAIPPGAAVTVAVRPENLAMATPGDRSLPENRVPCRVAGIQFAGPLVIVDAHAEAGGQLFRLRMTSNHAGARPTVGDAVALCWRADDCVAVPAGAAA